MMFVFVLEISTEIVIYLTTMTEIVDIAGEMLRCYGNFSSKSFRFLPKIKLPLPQHGSQNFELALTDEIPLNISSQMLIGV